LQKCEGVNNPSHPPPLVGGFLCKVCALRPRSETLDNRRTSTIVHGPPYSMVVPILGNRLTRPAGQKLQTLHKAPYPTINASGPKLGIDDK